MKRWLLAALMAAMGAGGVRAAAENFSKAMRPEDFSAAGLGKLSPEELGRLDALVRDFKTGALEAARREAAAKAGARAAAAESEKKASEPGLPAKAKVLLMPGTQVEYATVTSRIAGDFTGWEGRTMFKLENGQRWQAAAGSDSYVTPPIANPKVTIAPGMLGAFWMTIEGVKPRVKVEPVGGGK